MRKDGTVRLSNIQIAKNSRDYLVMFYLIRDLKYVIEQYAFGDVLDIGCGNKPYESLFITKTRSYIGCDVAQSDKKLVDVLCPATQLSFASGLFDTVFSTQVMEHVDNPAKMAGEAFRVLKPGGVIILSVPFCWELHEEPYDFFRFTKYGMKALLEREKFHVVSIKSNGGKWAAIAQMNLNILYSSFSRKSFLSRTLKFMFINLHLTQLVNSMAKWMDRKFYDELLTLNYVVVAQKDFNAK